MPVVPDDIARLLASRQNGTLATLRGDGRPQLSVVTYAWYPDDDGRELIRVSTVEGRAKVANLRRDPRASFLVNDDSGWSYAVVEGTVELSEVATSPDDEAVEELIRVYRTRPASTRTGPTTAGPWSPTTAWSPGWWSTTPTGRSVPDGG